MAILTAVNQADATWKIKENGYTEDILFLYTAEYGWTAYGRGYSDADTVLAGGRRTLHSQNADAYDTVEINDDGDLCISDESLSPTTPYMIVIEDFQTDLDDFEDTYLWQHYLQNIVAGQSYDMTEDELVDNDISDYDITDYIGETIGVNLYESFLDNATTEDAEDTDFTEKDTTGTRYLVPDLLWLNSETGRICLDFFSQTYTYKSSRQFIRYYDTVYKRLPGFPGQIVWLDSENYGIDAPANVLLCDGSTIEESSGAIPQLVGKTLPDLTGYTIASYDKVNHAFGSTEGAEAVTLEVADIPQLTAFIDESETIRPTGEVDITDPGHTHPYTDHYMYKVIRDSDDVDDNEATESGATIETGANDNYTFYWKNLSKSTTSKTTGISADVTMDTIQLEGIQSNINASIDEQGEVSVMQPTYYSKAYMIVY